MDGTVLHPPTARQPQSVPIRHFGHSCSEPHRNRACVVKTLLGIWYSYKRKLVPCERAQTHENGRRSLSIRDVGTMEPSVTVCALD